MKKSLQVNNMFFHLQDDEEITSVIVDVDSYGEQVIRIEGFTSTFEFVTTYYSDLIVSRWRGFGRYDIWAEDNSNIIAFEIIEEGV